ncbi:MAG: lytic murein transglycosylase, partial [Pseudomonadota bacterium]
MRLMLIFVLMIMCHPAYAQSKAKIERDFQTWLKNDLWPEARSQGVSKQTFQNAFKGVTVNWKLPDLVLPGQKAKTSRPQAQTEFRSPGRYFNENNIAPVVSNGRKLFAKHKRLLTQLEKRYGVPGRIILAIWGRESAFGRAAIPNDVFQVLGTKAFMSTRKPLFRKEVLAALQILQKGYAKRSTMKSSWA